MIIFVLLSILTRLAFIFTFIGPFACWGGAAISTILLVTALGSILFTISYKLPKFRYIVLLPLLGLCIMGNILDKVLVISTTGYLCYLAYTNSYEPTRDNQMTIFETYLKGLIAVTVILMITSSLDILGNLIAPLAVPALGAHILLLQSLRHEPKVYLDPHYQTRLWLILIAILAGGLFISSKFFLSIVALILETFMGLIVIPVVMLMTKGVVLLITLGARIINIFAPEFVPPETEMQFNMAFDELQQMEQIDPNTPIIFYVIIFLFVVAFSALIIWWVTRLRSDKPNTTRTTTNRSALTSTQPRKDAPESNAVKQVRQTYRKYLNHLSKKDIYHPHKEDTSETIMHHTNGDESSKNTLRDIYIKARYNNQADNEDVRKAKEALKVLRKE